MGELITRNDHIVMNDTDPHTSEGNIYFIF
jgi:hypothetical protein